MKKREGRRRGVIGLGVLALGLLALGLAWGPARGHVRAARMLRRFGDASAIEGVAERELTLAGLRARSYGEGVPILLVHGVHAQGIDEPRLRRFARLLAAEGLEVVTPELAALTDFRLEAGTAAGIGAAARALAEARGRARVGVVGISVGGGLALCAAAEEPRIGAILAIGPHHDARRLARWWQGDAIGGPDGEAAPAATERYGAQALAYAYAEEVFAEGDREAGRAALRAMLEERRPDLEGLGAEGRALVGALRRGPAPAVLAAVTTAHADALAAASPAGRLGRVRSQTFLLHGEEDPLVASIESAWISRELPAASLGGLVRTPLLRHAEGREVSWREQLAVVHLVAGALAALEEE